MSKTGSKDCLSNLSKVQILGNASIFTKSLYIVDQQSILKK